VGSVRPSYLGVLMSLWKADDRKVGDLGQAAGLEPSTMTGIIDRMVRDGLAVREADPTDRRAFRIRLTGAGRDLQAPVTGAIDRVMGRMLEGVDIDDLARLRGTLRRALTNVEEMGR